MAFFIKDFATITASLIERVASGTSQLTDFNVGSKIRTMLEAFSQELETLYLQMFRGILEGIDTGVYNSFDFPLLPATSASGQLTFSLTVSGATTPVAPTANIPIPAGFRLMIPVQATIGLIPGMAPSGTVYSVANNVVWPAGKSSFSTTAVCNLPGLVGNTIANSITSFVDNLPVIPGATYSVTNTAPFNNGQDQENQASRKARFSQYLQSLARGTLTAVEYGALQAVVEDNNGNITEQVKKVYAVEPYILDGSKPTGHCDVYVYNGIGSTSAALVANAQKIINGYVDANGNKIPGYKPAGTIVTVFAAVEQPQNVTLSTSWLPSYSLTTAVQSQIAGAIQQYFQSLGPGDTLLYNKLVEICMETTGIYDIVFSTPTADVVPPNAQTIITQGVITIS